MKLNIPILDIKGEEIYSDDNGIAITIFDLVISALLNSPLTSDESHRKSKRFVLAMKLTRNEDNDVSKIITAKDITEITDAVRMYHPPLTVGRIAEIIDPNSLEDE